MTAFGASRGGSELRIIICFWTATTDKAAPFHKAFGLFGEMSRSLRSDFEKQVLFCFFNLVTCSRRKIVKYEELLVVQSQFDDFVHM